ncbi:MAG: hypothetical protein JKY56_03520 [Kofleriaceae bacterium]|nr:hypothetical protein [Kofleriaceae bacterium]
MKAKFFGLLVATSAIGLGASCSDDGANATTALFSIPQAGQALADGFYALPYPNDLRLGEDGIVELTGLTRPNPLLEDYLDAVEDVQHGFGLTSSLHLRFDGAIDPASLPTSPTASLADDASVYLVNLNPNSSHYGEKVPLEYRFEVEAGSMIGENWLACLPFPGFVLEERTSYGLVVTERVLSEDGIPVGSSADFKIALSSDTATEASHIRAQEVYAPLGVYLDLAGGDERSDVVSAAVFTTQAPTELMGLFREEVDALPAPTARGFMRSSSTENYIRYFGRYDSPNFQAGNYPYKSISQGGGFEVDAEGKPIIQNTFDLRFSLTIPAGQTMPQEGWPVVLYAHGTGGDYLSYWRNGTASRYADAGLAVVSIDQVLHGDRLGPTQGDAQNLFFNFQNPYASRANVMQAALENFQLARLLEGIDVADPEKGGTNIRFDSDKMYFFGHSQGSITGLPYVSQSKRIKGAIFSGAGGLLYLSLLSKTEPFDITELLALIIRDIPLDKFNPALSLLQALYEPADAAVYARLLVDEPPLGLLPKNIFHLLGFTDNFTPVPTIEALATAIGGDLIAPELRGIEGLTLKGRTTLQPPFDGNAGPTDNPVTSVVAQYDQDPASDGHFVAFDIPAARRQTIEFLKTLSETGKATVVAP